MRGSGCVLELNYECAIRVLNFLRSMLNIWVEVCLHHLSPKYIYEVIQPTLVQVIGKWYGVTKV